MTRDTTPPALSADTHIQLRAVLDAFCSAYQNTPEAKKHLLDLVRSLPDATIAEYAAASCASAPIPDSRVVAALASLFSHLASPIVTTFVLQCLLWLKTLRRFQILVILSTTTPAALVTLYCQSLASDPVGCVAVLDDLVLGYQHSPDVFLKLSPVLTKAMEVTLDFANMYHKLPEAAWQFVFMIRCILHLHDNVALVFHTLHDRLCNLAEVLPVEMQNRVMVRVVEDHLRGVSWTSACLPIAWIEGQYDLEGQQHSLTLQVEDETIGYGALGQVHPSHGEGISMKGLLVPAPSFSTRQPAWSWEGLWQAYNVTTTAAKAVVSDWDCSSCTVHNAGTATKCSTCGTPAPPPRFTNRPDAPAPGQFVLSRDGSVFHGEVSRGYTSGSWLGVQVPTVDVMPCGPWETGAPLTSELCPAFGPVPGAASVFPYVAVHEIPSFSTFMVEAWASPQSLAGSQTLLAAAFGGIGMNETGALVAWVRTSATRDADGGPIAGSHHRHSIPALPWASALASTTLPNAVVLVSSVNLPSRVFSHVALRFDGQAASLFLNGDMVATAAVTVTSTAPNVPLVFGADIVRDVAPAVLVAQVRPTQLVGGYELQHPWTGHIIGARLWNSHVDLAAVLSRTVTRPSVLPMLAGYWSLIGSRRALADLSGHKRHGVLRWWVPAALRTQLGHVCVPIDDIMSQPASFPPTLGLATHAIGPMDVAGDVTLSLDDGQAMLQLGANGGASAALFRSKLAVAGGFEVRLNVSVLGAPVHNDWQQACAEGAPAASTLRFVLAHGSYWQIAPLDFAEDFGTQVHVGAKRKRGTDTTAADTPVVYGPGFPVNALVLDITFEADGGMCILLAVREQVTVRHVGRVWHLRSGGEDLLIRYSYELGSLCVGVQSRPLVQVPCDLSDWLHLGSQQHAWLALATPSVAADQQNGGIAIRHIGYEGTARERTPFLPTPAVAPANGAAPAPAGTGADAAATAGAAAGILDPELPDLEVIADERLCPTCTLANSLTATKCEACGTPLGPAAGPANSTVDPPPPASGWACPHCTTNNPAIAIRCSLCGKQPAGSSNEGEWSCTACTSRNAATATLCHVCSTPRTTGNHGPVNANPGVSETKSLDWDCFACTYHNVTGNSCIICGTPRPADTPAPAPSPAPAAGSNDGKASTATDSKDADKDKPQDEDSKAAKEAEALAEAARTVARDSLRGIQGAKAHAMSHLLPVVPSVQSLEWDTTLGVMEITLSSAVVAERVTGTLEGRDPGTVSGLAVEVDGQWQILASHSRRLVLQPNALIINLSATGEQMKLEWFRGDAAGEWTGNLVKDALGLKYSRHDAPGYSGLVNLQQGLYNICYQNSLLQALFMTTQFRRTLLASPLLAPRKDGLQPAWSHVLPHLFSKAAPFEPPAAPPVLEEDAQPLADTDDLGVAETKVAEQLDLDMLGGAGGCDNPALLSSRVQWLLGRLNVSQRPMHASFALQRALPAHFTQGRQHDIVEFQAVVSDAVSRACIESGAPDVMHNLFGCEIAEMACCSACGNLSVAKQTVTQLDLPMPSKFMPITNITAVVVPRKLGSMPAVDVPEGYTRVDMDLNKDRAGSPYIFLCLKRDPDAVPITEFRIILTDRNAKPTFPAGFTELPVDLNQGGNHPGYQVHFVYKREDGGNPITDMRVALDSDPVPDGYRKDSTNLNHMGGGTRVCLLYKQDMAVRDIQISSGGIKGYEFREQSLVIDGKEDLYLCYTNGGPKLPITHLELVPTEDRERFVQQGFELVPGGLLRGHRLMVRRGHGCPITSIDVFRGAHAMPKYQGYEWVDAALAASPPIMDGQWVAKPECTRRVVMFKELYARIDCLVIRGTIDRTTRLHGLAYRTVASGTRPNGYWNFYGMWQKPDWPCHKALHLELFDGRVEGTASSGAAEDLVVHGTKSSGVVPSLRHITDIRVLYGTELPPSGYSKIVVSCSKKSGNLNSGLSQATPIFLAVAREPNDVPIMDVIVLMRPGELERVPDDFQLVQTFTGEVANVNFDTPGSVMGIAFRRARPDEVGGLLNIDLVRPDASEPTPAGYRLVSLTSGAGRVSADLNSGTGGDKLLLAIQTTPDPWIAVEHVAAGTYDTTLGSLQVVVTAVTQCSIYEGKFDRAKNGKVHSVRVRDTDWQGPAGDPNMYYMCGYTSTDVMLNANGQACEWRLDNGFRDMRGCWMESERTVNWDLHHDDSVRIAFKRDYGTRWRVGRQLWTDRVPSINMTSLLNLMVSPRIMGGDNMVECGKCRQRCESERSVAVSKPPTHLVTVAQRMHFSAVQGKTIKDMSSLTLESTMQLPLVPETVATAVYGTPQAADEGLSISRRYGLYAIVVHSGATANSGHYYVYARSSGATDLHMDDSPQAPWVKFNDTRLTKTTWAEMASFLKSSVTDTAYMMFYKRLDWVPPTPLRGVVPMSPSAAGSSVPLAVVAPASPPPAVAPSLLAQMSADDDEDAILERALQMSLVETQASQPVAPPPPPPAPTALEPHSSQSSQSGQQIPIGRAESAHAEPIGKPACVPAWQSQIVADNLYFLLRSAGSGASRFLTATGHLYAQLRAGLSVDQISIAQRSEGAGQDAGADHLHSVLHAASHHCEFCCAPVTADRLAAHIAHCQYANLRPAECSSCHGLLPAELCVPAPDTNEPVCMTCAAGTQ